MEEEESNPIQGLHQNSHKKILLIFLSILILIGCAIGYIYLHDKNKTFEILAKVEKQEEDLNTRSKNILAITSTADLNTTFLEIDSIFNTRKELINQLSQEDSRFFKEKLEEAKNNMVSENLILEEEKVSKLKKTLEPLILTDNVAIGDVFSLLNEKTNISVKEFYAALDKNIEDRSALIEKIKLVPALNFTSILSGYVDLLNLENNLCRSYERYFLALDDFVYQWDWFKIYPTQSNLDDVAAANKKCEACLNDFNTDYKALLTNDKTFWEEAKPLLPYRDLQTALQNFYKEVNKGTKT